MGNNSELKDCLVGSHHTVAAGGEVPAVLLSYLCYIEDHNTVDCIEKGAIGHYFHRYFILETSLIHIQISLSQSVEQSDMNIYFVLLVYTSGLSSLLVSGKILCLSLRYCIHVFANKFR